MEREKGKREREKGRAAAVAEPRRQGPSRPRCARPSRRPGPSRPQCAASPQVPTREAPGAVLRQVCRPGRAGIAMDLRGVATCPKVSPEDLRRDLDGAARVSRYPPEAVATCPKVSHEDLHGSVDDLASLSRGPARMSRCACEGVPTCCEQIAMGSQGWTCGLARVSR